MKLLAVAVPAIAYGILRLSTMKAGSVVKRSDVEPMAERHGWNANAIYSVIMSESGGKPTAKNKRGGAVGLLQFMPATLRGMGLTSADVLAMNASDQLALVERWFVGSPLRKNASPGEYYAVVFLPGRYASRVPRKGDAEGVVLTERGEQYYDWNPLLDTNQDGKITVGDLTERLKRWG